MTPPKIRGGDTGEASTSVVSRPRGVTVKNLTAHQPG